jgi:hypothetical protein
MVGCDQGERRSDRVTEKVSVENRKNGEEHRWQYRSTI